MKNKNGIETIVDEANDNTDVIVEYLKMIVERLDKIINKKQ